MHRPVHFLWVVGAAHTRYMKKMERAAKKGGVREEERIVRPRDGDFDVHSSTPSSTISQRTGGQNLSAAQSQRYPAREFMPGDSSDESYDQAVDHFATRHDLHQHLHRQGQSVSVLNHHPPTLSEEHAKHPVQIEQSTSKDRPCTSCGTY